MQAIKLDAKSEVAESIVKSSYDSNYQTIVSIKSTSGESFYRALINKWVCKDDVLEVELENWNDYWGEVAATRYGA